MTVETTGQPAEAPVSENQGVAHLQNLAVLPRLTSYCGNDQRRHLGHYWAITEELCSCGAPACPACVSIWRLEVRTGIRESE